MFTATLITKHHKLPTIAPTSRRSDGASTPSRSTPTSWAPSPVTCHASTHRSRQPSTRRCLAPRDLMPNGSWRRKDRSPIGSGASTATPSWWSPSIKRAARRWPAGSLSWASPASGSPSTSSRRQRRSSPSAPPPTSRATVLFAAMDGLRQTTEVVEPAR